MIHEIIKQSSQISECQISASDTCYNHYSEDRIINMWLLTKHSPNTQNAYLNDISLFLSFCAKNLFDIKLDDIQKYMLHISESKNSTQRRKLATIKSLFCFCQQLGIIIHNPSKVIKLKRVPNNISEKILSEKQIKQIIAKEYNARNRILLKFLYITGARVSEVCNTKWKDFRTDDEFIYLSITGKGEKHNTIIIPESIWKELLCMKSLNHECVFTNRHGKALSRTQVFRIVKKAVSNAGIDKSASPHCFRHSMATTALRRGASLKLIQQQLTILRLQQLACTFIIHQRIA
jgi:integrase/recombinase XerD